MTHEARIAANRLFDYLPYSKILPNLWKENLLLNNFVLSRKAVCHCEDYLTTNIPVIYPIFPSTGESAKGLFSSLSFAYISWIVNSRTLPHIEVIEVPIFMNEILFENQEREKLERSLSPQGITVIGSYTKVTNENYIFELLQIRKRVLTKIFEFSHNTSYIYLSIFSNLPKSLVEEKDSRYLSAIDELENKTSWAFQSQRLMPITYQKEVLLFSLKCWILTKKDLKLE
ncbi:hypothetical protein [Fluviispira multicolorata]|uniref:Uncharacterized protein n=1 Tax=Fluviispira multicolorata TaxID=2654512 RepID=A0A833JCN5_9BACT|nr:hypothetical protein [Fluviispira multicolorata]KAB8030813.1 hypothetical protein GCL57_07515 [Fluviispira multicolorata]